MDEAQALADRVAIIAAGRIVAEGAPADLPGRAVPREDRVELRTTEPTRALHVLTAWALARGEELDALTVTRPSLEDVYLQLTSAQEELTHA